MDIDRRRLTLASLLLLAAGAAALWLALGGGGTPARAAVARTAVSTARFPSGPGHAGIFTERCRFSHEAADDPILMPGRPGAAMHHDFFGNVTTGASSTAQTLAHEPTTCATSADHSAYWIPQLYQDGRPLMPRGVLLYWRRRRGRGTVSSVPQGLEMIAGDETARRPQGVTRVAWSCVGPATRTAATRPPRYPTPHSCESGLHVKLTIFFPSCWDGHRLSAVGQTNVVYPLPGRAGCPASHPVLIPQIVLHAVYPTSSAAGLTLSMSPTMRGSTDTAHADFIDGWTPSVLAADVRGCLGTPKRCGPVKGPQATPQGPRDTR